MTEPIDTVAKAIVQAQLHHCDLTGREIARRTGISAAYYSDIRKGNRIPSPEILGRFATVLHTPVAPLLWLWITQHMGIDKAKMVADWLRQ